MVQRVSDAKRATTKGVLSDLGVNSVDEAKALIAAQKASDDANRTEQERVIARALEREAAAAARESAAAVKEHSLNVAGALMDAGAPRGNLEDLSLLLRVDPGADSAAIAAAAEALKAKYPTLFGAQTAPLASSEPTGGGAPSRPNHSPDAFAEGKKRAEARNPEGKRSLLP